MDTVPEADDVVERFERFIFDFDFDDYNAVEAKDEAEKSLMLAIKNGDVSKVNEILDSVSSSQSISTFQLDGTPLLVLATVAGNIDVIKCIIDRGCDIRDTDWSGNSALHMAVWNRRTPYFYNTRWSRNEPTCKGCDVKLHRLDIVDILLKSYKSDTRSAFENVFVDTNKNGVTPFVRACAAGCDAIVMRFLKFLDELKPKFLTTDIFADSQGNNIFHYILDSSTYHMTVTRPETLKVLLEKMIFSKQLLHEKNCSGITPLEILARPNLPDWPEIPDIIQTLLSYGADPDFFTIDGNTFLSLVIKNEEIAEILLRAGCDPNLCGRGGFTPLSLALNRHQKDETRPSVSIIDRLLAFGANLNNELYLYEPEERPGIFDSPEYASQCDSSSINPEILKLLIDLRKSNVLMNLKRLCRNTIRRTLKPNADEKIRNLTGVPGSLKSYLLLENEPGLLGIS